MDKKNSPEKIIPEFCKKYFWDTNPNNLEVDENYFFIIERLLETGDDPSIKWLLNYYPREKFIKVVKYSRKLSPKTANFWCNYLNLEKEEVRCLSTSFRKGKEAFWKV
ncbi:MAG: hypothetical protein D5R97_04035 [Candidatus Syntrophonatronum acetioxidans]|uniref:DUF6922 domain-containing protein n=1 Tax=Candidatus Syntrophonatronum acetioxidans TaxID=1795816 RepID=A0A424YFV2_9FIRM|nr:MAG: hypothetical protein D5R97_04035 [Candidatus Syntrophonatronum acetioxidans]